jgi:hypothetical protein
MITSVSHNDIGESLKNPPFTFKCDNSCKLISPVMSTYQPTIINWVWVNISVGYGSMFCKMISKFPIHPFYYTLYTICITRCSCVNTIIINPSQLNLVGRHWTCLWSQPSNLTSKPSRLQGGVYWNHTLINVVYQNSPGISRNMM